MQLWVYKESSQFTVLKIANIATGLVMDYLYVTRVLLGDITRNDHTEYTYCAHSLCP